MKKRHMIIAICLFYFFNCFASYFLTTQPLNEYYSSFQRGFLSEVCSILGNISVLTILLSILFTFVHKGNRRVIGMGIISMVLGFLIFALKIYTKYYETVFSFQTLSVFKNPAANLGLSIINEALKEFFTNFGFVLLIPGIALIVYGIILTKKNYTFNFATKRTSLLFRTTIILASMVGSMSTYMIYVNLAQSIWPYQSDSTSFGIQYCGVYNFYIYDACGVSYRVDSKTSEIEEINEEIAKYNKNGEHVNILDGKTYDSPFLEEYNLFDGKNLYVVHMESVSNFIIDLTVNNIEITPNLNKLKSNSNVYWLDKLYTTSGQGVSADAELANMAGIFANGSSTLHWDYENTNYDFDALPELFKAKYKTSYVESFHGDIRAFYNRESVHEKLFGFDNYYSVENYQEEHPDASMDSFINGWVSDHEMFNWVDEHIRLYDSNYFVYNILTVSHTPFLHNPIEDSLKLNLKSEILTRYLTYMRYVDNVIGDFIQRKKEDTNTLFYFYGDHGCGINDGSLFELFPNYTKIEMANLLRQDVGFFYDPSGTLATFLKGNMRQPLLRNHVDMNTTLLSLFGLRPSTYTYGVNAFSNEPSFAYNPVSLYIFTDDYFYSVKRPEYLTKLKELDNKTVEVQVKAIEDFKKYMDGILKYNLTQNYKVE